VEVAHCASRRTGAFHGLHLVARFRGTI